MALFYLETKANGRVVRNPDGMEFEDCDAARRAAIRALPTLADEALPDGDPACFAVIVRDERAQILYTASLNFLGLWGDR